jgi:ABC-type Fe3+ transport system substrate-binding protein
MGEATPRRDFLKYLGSGVLGAIIGGAAVAASGAAAPPPSPETVTVTRTEVGAAQTVTQTVTATATTTVTAQPPTLKAGWEGAKWIPIVNKKMTFKEVQEALKSEGKVTIANWTYWGLTETQFAPDLKQYVAELYDVDIEVEILGTQAAKGGFMFQLYSAYSAGLSAPYDVMHLESNFFAEALAKDVAEPFIPSPLLTNLPMMDYYFIKHPYGLQFQNHALANFTVNTEQVGNWFTSWKDLADPKLEGKITLWVLEDNGFWGWLTVMAGELGKDFKNPEEMKEVIQWIADNIHPNVLKYTSDEAELDELIGRDITWVNAYWCALAEGYAVTRPELKGSQVLPWEFKSDHVNLPGILWIPKKTDHPLLAQIAADWLVSPRHQFIDIDKWPEVTKELWLRTEEGLLGADYEPYVPGWLSELGPKGIHEVYPTVEAARKYPEIDWVYVNENAPDWISTYQDLIG